MNQLAKAELRALVDRLYKAITTGDSDALMEILHPDFVGRVTPGLPKGVGGLHRGPAAMRDEVWWTLGRHFRVGVEVEQAASLDDGRLLIVGLYKVEGRRSRKALDAEFVHLIGFADGRIASIHQVTDSARFVEALGDVA
ncbi:MAG: nuclear transport factor 2 family protein [Hydrogenophaga sp.]|uniref:nuclear transport factor 2 family protein n=1 Tax=Hydrogenophaga sp. TaxID=1904254 RepID=UPI003D127917